MKKIILIFIFITGSFLSCQSQLNGDKNNSQPPRKNLAGIAAAATDFLKTLTAPQKDKAQFEFNADERFNWHYIPKERKGLPVKEMTDVQQKAAMALLHAVLSDSAYNKVMAIMHHEVILKEMESRPADDNYRDPGKYYFSIFGNPEKDSVWGWRFEGHHVSYNFSAKNNSLISGTPGFMGSNPAVVLSGPEKGKFILSNESDLGFALLHALNNDQLKKTMIDEKAPSEIITAASRKAMIENPAGILYNELNKEQQKMFMELLSLYIHRYTKLFAATMMKEIETAGLNNLRFAWAGMQQYAVGNPHYYRIQGPTIIIEFDNTQNNANHIHTVIRDLKNDFGDELLEHYKTDH